MQSFYGCQNYDTSPERFVSSRRFTGRSDRVLRVENIAVCSVIGVLYGLAALLKGKQSPFILGLLALATVTLEKPTKKNPLLFYKENLARASAFIFE